MFSTSEGTDPSYFAGRVLSFYIIVIQQNKCSSHLRIPHWDLNLTKWARYQIDALCMFVFRVIISVFLLLHRMQVGGDATSITKSKEL